MRADEEHAFADFVNGRVLALRRTAYRLCGDWHEADDLVQNTMIRLYRYWPRIQAAGSLDAYARQVMVNTFLRQRQTWWSRWVRPSAEPIEQAESDRPTDGRLDLLAALARISAGQRAVLVLRYWEGLNVAETALVLGCSTGTVKSQTSNAIAALRRLMPEYVRAGK